MSASLRERCRAAAGETLIRAVAVDAAMRVAVEACAEVAARQRARGVWSSGAQVALVEVEHEIRALLDEGDAVSAHCNCTASTSPDVRVVEHAADCPRAARPSEAARDRDTAPRAPTIGADTGSVAGGLGAGDLIDRVAGAIWVAGLPDDERAHGPTMRWRGMLAAIEGPDAEACYRDGAHCGDCTQQIQTCERCVVEDAREQARAALAAVGECASCADAARVIDGLLAVRGVTEAADEPRPHAEGYGCPECDQRRCEDAAIGAAFRWLDGRRAEVARWEATARQHLDAPSYRALSAVQVERRRQDAKWGEQNHEPVMWIAILTEEVGEAASAALHLRSGDPDACEDDLRAELVQVAAVAVAAIEALDRRRETP